MLKKFLSRSAAAKKTPPAADDAAPQGAAGQTPAADLLAAARSGDLSKAVDPSAMNPLQRMAWKRFQKMDPARQRALLAKMMTPENIAKHRKDILAQLEALKAAGMLSDDQYRLARRRFHL